MKYKSPLYFFIALSTVLFDSQVNGEQFDYSMPIKAIEDLRSSYITKDIDQAVSLIDFTDQAKRMAERFDIPTQNGGESLNEMANELELKHRNSLENNGPPDYSGVQCEFTGKKRISRQEVIITEVCDYGEGIKTIIDIAVVENGNKWKVSGPILPDIK